MIARSLLIPAWMLIFGMAADCAFAKKSTGPKLFLPETEYEFSGIYEGDPVQHQFILQNKGKSPLEITDVETD